MALPKSLHLSLSPQELTFIAEQDEIEIIPSFTMGKFRLLSGIYGPFEPPRKVSVPIWLALSLKRKKKCRIVCPEWFTVENLTRIIQSEKDSPESFISLPRHFIEVSKLLLDIAPTDLSSPSTLHSLLLTLRHIRLSKIRLALRPPSQSQSQSQFQSSDRDRDREEPTDLGPFSGKGEYLKLTGLTPFEVAEMKGFLKGVMGMMVGLNPGSGGGGGGGQDGNASQGREGDEMDED